MSYLGVLPPELLREIFQQYVRIERARYLEQIGAPRGEYSIRDSIQEHGQPVLSSGSLDLTKIGLTCLDGLELINNPEQIEGIYLSGNYISNYYDPYLDPYVYYVVHDMTPRGPIEPFRGFPNLLVLYLRNNQLTTLPEGVFNGVHDLEFLYLANNHLTMLPERVFKGLQSLESLHLENNHLTTLPEGVFNGLPNLRWLFLGNNHLTTLPEGVFKGLQSFENIFLENNQLSGTEEEFRKVHGLRRDKVRILWKPQEPPAGLYHLLSRPK
jgi:hypothetical protein